MRAPTDVDELYITIFITKEPPSHYTMLAFTDFWFTYDIIVKKMF